MIYQRIHIDAQIIASILTDTEVVESRIDLVGTKDDSARVPRDNRHLRLVDEIAEIMSKGKASVEIPIRAITLRRPFSTDPRYLVAPSGLKFTACSNAR